MPHPRFAKLAALLLVATAAYATFAPSVAGHEEGPVTLDEVADRYLPRMPGVQREMTFYYGPFTIPPGQDNNRVALDLPLQDGFLVSVQANVYDAFTGARPSNQDMHIHHAHWFRASEDPNDEYYVSGGGHFGIAWVFGTGEERTKGDIEARSSKEGPDGPRYGIFIEAGQPQVLIYMLHNKNAQTQNVYVALDVTFVYGSAEQILDAPAGCGPLPLAEGGTCRAGERFHHLHGKLWGNTFDVPRDFDAWARGEESLFVWSPDDHANMMFRASADGTAIGTAGHLHPNGLDVIIANLGPANSGCEADVDGDGYPGVTLAVSHKFSQVANAVASEEYQMGVTQDGWRAPIRAGDRIAQFGTYLNHEHASYEAMSYAGMYVDRQQPPAPHAADCTSDLGAAAFFAAARAYLVEGGAPLPYVDAATYRAQVVATKLNDDWEGRHSHGHCGLADDPTTPDDESKPCDDDFPLAAPGSGRRVSAVHIADFLYLPGDHSLSGALGAPALVTRGEPLLFVNEDLGIGVRHTVTSCKYPCNGAYVANYPHPDGHFDSDKMGNYDYIDGGLVRTGGSHSLAGHEYEGPGVPASTYPTWTLDTTDLDPGIYSYYCRIHPWMRGWVEVAAP
ncbi:MAG TPA: hypothetical protein VM582_04500 [Candidatus Thermoplasmatota archaeon]|nr:hypothetical protein [Candidatus Thermoplasmatota archaeon]